MSSVVDGMSEVRTEETLWSISVTGNLVRSDFNEVLGPKTDWHILKGDYWSAVESEKKILPGRMLLGRIEDME